MELGKQIKKYRNERSLSQDALAEKYTFQGRQSQIGRMIKVIRMLIVLFC